VARQEQVAEFGRLWAEKEAKLKGAHIGHPGRYEKRVLASLLCRAPSYLEQGGRTPPLAHITPGIAHYLYQPFQALFCWVSNKIKVS
jgi:hypothetical protein